MKKLKAGIYDRWLFTLGGGEQVAFAYAEVLKELNYHVSLITHKKIDSIQAEKKMGISLDDIEIIYLPECSSESLSGITEKFDLFINTSHLDYFANRAKKSILSVFFPGTIKLNPIEYLKRAFFIPSFRKLFIYPSRYEGFSFDQPINGKIYKWLSKESSIVFNQNIYRFSILLYFENFTFSVIDKIKFSLGDDKIQYLDRKVMPETNQVKYSFKVIDTKDKKFSILLPENKYSENIALISLTIPSLRYFLYNVFKKIFPRWEMRLHGGPGITKISDLQSYNKIITISTFCKKWINKYWGLNSNILYPSVNTEHFYASKTKKNIILHIGRFFITGHSKKQLELVKVFKKMISKNNAGDWELHFVGSIEDGESHRQYYLRTQLEAKGAPIFFHIGMNFENLRELLSKAKIYWHATGLDEDEDNNPIAFEHFGITTVEAMASGVVPVVINKGGQSEIVNEKCGFKWDNREELIKYTMKLIKNPELLNNLSKESIKRSKYFSKENFKKNFIELIKSC